MSRQQFYEYNRRFQTHGLEGLKYLPPVAQSHPQTTPDEVVERIQELALAHPSDGCNRLEALLKAEGHKMSSVTAQKVPNKHELGSRYQRWLALERHYAEQAAFIDKQTPCFRERHVKSSGPGELLSQDTF